VYYSGQGTGLRALRLDQAGETGGVRELWHNADLGTVYNTPVLRDGLLFAISPRGQFFCLEAATGSARWHHTERVSNFGSMVDVGGVLLALTEKTGLIVLKPSGSAYEELARYVVSATPVYAHPVPAGRRIYVRDRDSVTAWLVPAE
jgi:outer membrane protein assembly factor BamB